MCESVRSGSGIALIIAISGLLVGANAGGENPNQIWVPFVDSASITFDGLVAPFEWDDAGRYDISDVLGLKDEPDAPGSVILYASHNDSFLRIAIENKADSMLSADDVFFFWADDNNNDILEEPFEGHYKLVHLLSGDSVIFFPHLGFPLHTDFTISVGDAQGYSTFEAALALGDPQHFLNAQTGETLGAWMCVRDGVALNLNGVWPPVGGSQLIHLYGDFYLAVPAEVAPPSPPDQVSVREERPDTVVIEWDNPFLDLVGDSLNQLDSIFIYRDGIRIASIHTTVPGVHNLYYDASLELARARSYRLSVLSVIGGSPVESPRTWPQYGLPGYLCYEADFETLSGGWVPYPDTSWEWGIPGAAGPGRAHSGEKCWATRLLESYLPSARWQLISPPIFLGKYPVSRATLSFYHYYWTENLLDGGNVKISVDDGETWIVIAPDSGYPADGVAGLGGEPGFSGFSGGWVYSVFDLSAYLGDTLSIMLDFGSDGSTEFPGWYFDDIVVAANGPTTGADDERFRGRGGIPLLALRGIPNPARTGVSVEYGLPEPLDIDLSVYDLSGRRVASLESGSRAAGNHKVIWDLRDGRGDSVPSGVYFCRLDTGVNLRTEKLIVAR